VKLVTYRIEGATTAESEVELVERKGIGHADSLADGISEYIELSIVRRASSLTDVPYHFSDKVLIVGGRSEPAFGGGKILKPAKISPICVGDPKILDISRIAAYSREYVERIIPRLAPEALKVEPEVIPATRQAFGEYSIDQERCDDTCIAVAYGPLSPSEQLVLNIERHLISVRSRLPMIGPDIKVMLSRVRESVDITIACAFIDSELAGIQDYLEAKDLVANEATRILERSGLTGTVGVNIDDIPNEGLVYITVTGSSIEHGECGFSGRGNRANGLISPLRWMTIEAISGKSIINHPAKLYSLCSQKLCDETLLNYPEVKEISVVMMGRIGEKLSRPHLCFVRYNSRRDFEKEIERELERILADLDGLRSQYVGSTSRE